MITLYDKTTNKKLAYLDDIIIEDTIEITRKINGEFTLKFEALEENLKSEYFEAETYISVDGYYFDIAYIEQVHADKVTYRIECEHVTYRLINDTKDFYTYDGTPTEILADILADTDFTVGTIYSTNITTFAVYEETNKLGLIQLFANKLNLEIDYDEYSISLKNTVGQDRGFQVRFGKNLLGVKKIIDKRKELTYYSVDIVELKNHPSYKEFSDLEVIEEGDTIQIIDEVMGLDVTNKVISRTYNPIKSINTLLEIANSIELLTDTVTQIKRDTVVKDKTYHGIRISPTYGFESIRSDNKARGVFNSDIFALQSGDGTGINWTNKLYFDPVTGKYIFDGTLSAQMIEALEAQFDITISNTVITQTLSAETGNIAQLTVDQVETSTKVQNYLNNNISDVNYIKIFEQYIKFITASTDGTTTEQATDRKGNLLYWIDETYSGTTLDETNYPVMIYAYNELIKMEIAFKDVNDIAEPQIILGTGEGTTALGGKASIHKLVDGLEISYYSPYSENKNYIKITDYGVFTSNNESIEKDLIVYKKIDKNIGTSIVTDDIQVQLNKDSHIYFNYTFSVVNNQGGIFYLELLIDDYSIASASYKTENIEQTYTFSYPIIRNAKGSHNIQIKQSTSTGTAVISNGFAWVVSKGLESGIPPVPEDRTPKNSESINGKIKRVEINVIDLIKIRKSYTESIVGTIKSSNVNIIDINKQMVTKSENITGEIKEVSIQVIDV